MSHTDLIDVTGLSDEECRALITPEMLEEGERTMAGLRRVMDSLSEDTGQTAYSSLMDTCPFCGGRAWIQYWEYPSGGGMEGRAVCGGCHVSTSRDFQSGRTTYLPTGEDITKPLLIKQIIETWNRRAELRSKSVELHPVDRDALLALADEIEGNDVTYCVSTQYVLDSYARRIRDALGVES